MTQLTFLRRDAAPRLLAAALLAALLFLTGCSGPTAEAESAEPIPVTHMEEDPEAAPEGTKSAPEDLFEIVYALEPDTEAAEAPTTGSADGTELAAVEEADLRFSLVDRGEDGLFAVLENRSSRSLLFTFDELSVNDCMIGSYAAGLTDPGETEYAALVLDEETLARYSITSPGRLEGRLRVYDAADPDAGPVAQVDVRCALSGTGDSVFPEVPEDAMISWTGEAGNFSVLSWEEIETGGYSLSLRLENLGEERLCFYVGSVDLDGVSSTLLWYEELPAGKLSLTTLELTTDLLEECGTEDPVQLDFVVSLLRDSGGLEQSLPLLVYPHGEEAASDIEKPAYASSGVNAGASYGSDASTTVTVLIDGVGYNMSLFEYLCGVVTAEMPVSFGEEALKAQAVAARSYTLNVVSSGKHNGAICTDPGCCQAWSGSSAAGARLAVAATDGLVLKYNGTIISAMYSSSSGGRTESAAVACGTEIPYLQAVDSPGEEASPHYDEQTVISLERFRSWLTAQGAVLTASDPADWTDWVLYTDGGAISQISFGGVTMSGARLRNAYGLTSTLFTLEYTDTSVIFHSYGYGHRVGLSQYGAAAMAAAGCSWEDIVLHYYTGVVITTP